MQYQKQPPAEVLEILKKAEIEAYQVSYYAWPQTFGSTCGPRHGIGGQAMSDFTVEAWVCNGVGPTVFTCAGMYHLDKDKFEPFKQIHSWRPIPTPEN